jgi:hypothetical protein
VAEVLMSGDFGLRLLVVQYSKLFRWAFTPVRIHHLLCYFVDADFSPGV